MSRNAPQFRVEAEEITSQDKTANTFRSSGGPDRAGLASS
jgi:hypothetical protein